MPLLPNNSLENIKANYHSTDGRKHIKDWCLEALSWLSKNDHLDMADEIIGQVDVFDFVAVNKSHLDEKLEAILEKHQQIINIINEKKILIEAIDKLCSQEPPAFDDILNVIGHLEETQRLEENSPPTLLHLPTAFREDATMPVNNIKTDEIMDNPNPKDMFQCGLRRRK